MAKKEDNKKIERVYNIPLRKEWLKSPRYKRSKKAIFALRQFLSKHMKSEEVSIGKHLNEDIWKRGIKSPPHHVKVNVIKYEDGKVVAELFGKPIEEQKEAKKKKEQKEEKTEAKQEAAKEEKQKVENKAKEVEAVASKN